MNLFFLFLCVGRKGKKILRKITIQQDDCNDRPLCITSEESALWLNTAVLQFEVFDLYLSNLQDGSSSATLVLDRTSQESVVGMIGECFHLFSSILLRRASFRNSGFVVRICVASRWGRSDTLCLHRALAFFFCFSRYEHHSQLWLCAAAEDTVILRINSLWASHGLPQAQKELP